MHACMRVESFSYAKLVKLHLCASVRSKLLSWIHQRRRIWLRIAEYAHSISAQRVMHFHDANSKGPCMRWADMEKRLAAPLESGTPLIGLDGRCAAVFADRTPPSPIIRDFFVMSAAGRKITLLPAELIYLGRSLLSASMGRMRRPPLQISPPFESGHVWCICPTK